MEHRFRRREWKYLVARPQADALEAALCTSLVADPFGDQRGRYRVTSRYFDTRDLAIYRDRVLHPDSDGPTKLRLRVYGEVFDYETPAMVELKSTIRGISHKQRLETSLASAVELTRGEAPVASMPDMLLATRVARLVRTDGLVPVCDISYERTALMSYEDGVRVTFDRDLIGRKLRHEPAVSSPVLASDTVVVELKIEQAVPSWLLRRMDGLLPLEEGFSKYVRAMGGSAGLEWELGEVTAGYSS